MTLSRGERIPAAHHETASVACAPGVTYVAAVDGWVSARVGPHPDPECFAGASVYGVVDGVLMMSATAGNLGGFSADWGYQRIATTQSFLMPVPARAPWSVQVSPFPGSDAAMPACIHFMPLARSLPTELNAAGPATPVGVEGPSIHTKPWQDFEPAMRDLVTVLERVVGRDFSQDDKHELMAVMKRLI